MSVFEQFFTVSANDSYGNPVENVDFYLYLGEPLHPDSNTFQVMVLTKGGDLNQDLNSVSESVQVNITSDFDVPSIDRIEANPENVSGVYVDSTTEEEMRNLLVVKVYYEGISDPVEIRDYDMIWNNQTDSVITISFGGASDTVDQTVTELEVDSLYSAEVTGTIHSSDNEDRMKNSLTVVAKKNDGKLHTLRNSEFSALADLYSGPTGTDNIKTITVSVDGIENTVQISNVVIEASTADDIYGSLLSEYEFYAYSEPSTSYVTDVTVEFTDGQRKDISSHYSLEFRQGDATIQIDDLAAETYSLYIVYQENGEPVEHLLSSSVEVSPFPITYPTIDGSIRTYNTQEQRWQVYTDHPEVLVAVFTCSICGADNEHCTHIEMHYDENNVLYVYATETGNYTVEFTLNNTNSYEWADGQESHNPYSLTITAGVPVVTLDEDSSSGWVYGEYSKPGFSATLDMGDEYQGNPIILGSDDITWSGVDVYVSDNANGTGAFILTDATDWNDFHVGTWYVQVVIDQSDAPNLVPTTTQWGQDGMSFEITPNILTATVSSGTYGESGSPEITLTGSNQNGVSESLYTYAIDGSAFTGQTYDAGDYELSITLDEDDFVNYRWSDPDTEGGRTATISWHVNAAAIDAPSPIPVDGATYKYDGTTKTWTLTNSQGTVFDNANFTFDFSCSDGITTYDDHGMSISGNNTLSATDAGAYTVSITPKVNAKDETNYVWTNEDQNTGAVNLTVKIDKRPLTVTATLSGGLTYGSTSPDSSFVPENFISETDGYNLVFNGWAEGDGSDPRRHIESLVVSTDYDQGDDATENGKYIQYSISISEMVSRNYALVDGSGTFTIDKAQATITGASVDPINYRDALPQDVGKYRITITGLVLGQTLSTSGIQITITTAYRSGDNAMGWQGDDSQGYEITLTADSDNYKVAVNDDLGYMVVNRLVAMVSWDGGDNEFPFADTQGNPPGFSVTSTHGTLANDSEHAYYTFVWLDSSSTEIGSGSTFDYGDYTLRVTLLDTNYTWPDAVSEDGVVADYPFTITHIPYSVTISIDQSEWTYGFSTEEIKSQLRLGGGIQEDLSSTITGMFDTGNYRVYYVTSNDQYISDPYDLDAESSYGIHVVFGNVETYYVTGDIDIADGIRVAPKKISVSQFQIPSDFTYRNQDQFFEVTLDGLNALLGGSIVGGNTTAWTVSVDGTPVGLQNGAFTITLHDAGTYRVTYSVASDNHTFTYPDGAVQGTFTITVNPETPDLEFQGDNDGVVDLNASYRGTFGATGFTEPAASVKYGETDETFSWSFTLNGNPYDWDGLMSRIVNAGTYTVTYVVQSTNDTEPGVHNYRSVGTLTFVVSEAAMTPKIILEDDIEGDDVLSTGYDTQPHQVSVSMSESIGNVKWNYSVVDGNNTNVASGNYTDIGFSFTLTDAGTYTLTFSAEKDNYVTIENRSITITINRASSDVEINFNNDANNDGTKDSYQYVYGEVFQMSGTPISDVNDPDADWSWLLMVSGHESDEPIDSFEDLIDFFDNAEMGVKRYAVSYTLSDLKGNHVDCKGTFDVHVEKKSLTLVVNTDEDGNLLTYGDARPDAESMVSGFVYDQTFDGVFVDASIGLNYNQWDPAGDTNSDGQRYAIDGRTLESDNYDANSLYSEFTVDTFHIDLTMPTVNTQYGLVPNVPDAIITTTLPDGMNGHGPFYTYDYRIVADDPETSKTLDEAILEVDTYYIVAVPGSNFDIGYTSGPGVLNVDRRVIPVDVTDATLDFRGQAYTYREIVDSKFQFTYPEDFPDNLVDEFLNSISLMITPLDGDQLTSDGLPVDAGRYRATVSVGNAHYTVSLPDGFQFTINQLSYGVEVAFGLTNSVTYDGDSHDFAIWMRSSSEGWRQLTSDDWDTVALAQFGEEDLTVSYTVNGNGIGTYPQYTNAGEYNITAVFSGSDNYVIPEGLSTTFTITQAVNHWTYEGAASYTEWLDRYEYGDFDYSQFVLDNAAPDYTVLSLFGEVVSKFYVQNENNQWVPMGDNWYPESDGNTPVGIYRVEVFVNETDNYTDLYHMYEFEVSKLGLTVSLDEETSIYNDGNPVNNRLIGYDQELMNFHRQSGDVTIDDEGNLTGYAAGDNVFSLELEHPESYYWEDSEDTYLSMNWVISSENVINRWVQIPSIGDWTYGDNPLAPSAEPAYGQVVFTYKDSEGNISSTVPSDAGKYTLIAHVEEGTQDEVGAYSGLDTEVEFTIHPYRVPIPEMKALNYTGESLSVPYENLVQTFYDKETSIYTVFGNSETEIGDYIATLTLTDTNNFVWQDDTTEPKEITWRIISGDVPTYADFAIDDGDEVYTGHRIEKNVICLRDGWNEGEHYTVTHTDNVNVGTATITVSGTAVDAATGESTPWFLTFTFEIVKATPVLDFVNEGFTSYEDNGTFELRPYLSDEAGLSDLVWTSSDESVATVDGNGIVTLRGLGTAEITATLPGSENWNEAHDSYELTVNETQTEIVVVPGPGGSGGSGDGGVIYIPTVIREDAGISDMTWLIILACVVVVMLALIWLLWNRRTEGDGA